MKNTLASENSLCLWVCSIAPVGHSVHLNNSCCLAYKTSPAPVISKSRVTLNSSNGSFRKGYGATRNTQSFPQKNVRYIRHHIGYDIGYDIICDIRASRGYAGKHLGHLSELSFFTDKAARFLFEFHADDFKSLGLPVIPPFASSGTIHKLLKTNHKPRMYRKNI
jgi:hypothetical protein